jgi:hypothetical protein
MVELVIPERADLVSCHAKTFNNALKVLFLAFKEELPLCSADRNQP